MSAQSCCFPRMVPLTLTLTLTLTLLALLYFNMHPPISYFVLAWYTYFPRLLSASHRLGQIRGDFSFFIRNILQLPPEHSSNFLPACDTTPCLSRAWKLWKLFTCTSVFWVQYWETILNQSFLSVKEIKNESFCSLACYLFTDLLRERR